MTSVHANNTLPSHPGWDIQIWKEENEKTIEYTLGFGGVDRHDMRAGDDTSGGSIRRHTERH